MGIGLDFFDPGTRMLAVCEAVIAVLGNLSNIDFVNTVHAFLIAKGWRA